MTRMQVGNALGLAPARMGVLAVGGLLHDIDKLAISDDVLKKPAALDDQEFAETKRHPEAGFLFLTQLGGFPKSVRRLVLNHHERLDGRGYPRGLRGSDLDLETRVLTVCDVYDALVSDRVYRQAWSPAAALALLKRDTGAAFDARCVAALEHVLNRCQGSLEADFVATVSTKPERLPHALTSPRTTTPGAATRAERRERPSAPVARVIGAVYVS